MARPDRCRETILMMNATALPDACAVTLSEAKVRARGYLLGLTVHKSRARANDYYVTDDGHHVVFPPRYAAGQDGATLNEVGDYFGMW